MSDVETPDFDGVRWTAQDLEDMCSLYWSVVAPRLEDAGKDPESHRPTHQWFRDEGLRAFLAALRRHHDRSFGDFWREDLGLGDDQDEEKYAWATDDERTIDALERFIERRRDRHDLSESSMKAKRRRLNLYVRAYKQANGEDDLLTPVVSDSEMRAHEAVERCWAAFDHLNNDDYAATTKQRVRRVVNDFYTHLMGRKIATTNPASGLFDEFKWESTAGETPSLDAEHIQALMETAETARDRLLVVALAAWGLRANEVAALHIDQITRAHEDPDAEVAYLRFEERKNGPGEVSLLYGLDVLDERIDDVSADNPEWTGYLFPSPSNSRAHITRSRIWAWFRDLATDADLPDSIEGESPSPQLCRRYWYDTYTDVLEGVLEGVEDIAAEQGSSDPKVVMQNYLSEGRSRSLRREFMREQLAEAFGEAKQDPEAEARA